MKIDFSRYGSLIVSVGIHIALFLVAGGIVVYRAVKPPKPLFTASAAGPKLKARELKHRLQCKKAASYGQSMAKNMRVSAKCDTSSLTLPEPEMVKPNVKRENEGLSLSDNMSFSLGDAGLGKAPKGGDGWGEIEFLGQRIAARSIVILVDSSSSIVQKGVFEAVRKEAEKTVELFHPDTLFNVVLFTDGKFPFRTNLCFATKSAKRELSSWLAKEMKVNRGNDPDTSGSTPIKALEFALSLKPDAVVLISDDPPYLQGEDEIVHERRIMALIDESRREKATQINAIAYRPARDGSVKRREKAERGCAFLKRVASHGKGEFREVE
ncbi:VWA domain-containing protein [bacterium]|nr:VWA domain-containing protein [bacterium]